MKLGKIFLTLSILFFLSSPLVAAEFYWANDLNREAERDRYGYASRLSNRFQIGIYRVNSLLEKVKEPADVYFILRFAEMSQKTPEYVFEQYKANKGKGWGVLAQRLGIKPGSKEFHELKKGHDLNVREIGSGKGESNGKVK